MTMICRVSRRVPFVALSSFLAVGLSAGVAGAGVWQPAGVGDCPGRDVGGSRGSTPEASRCDASFAGQTAVCWANGCTYKTVPTASCKGGASPGQMYTCAAASAPAPAPTGPTWQPVGLGDCPGRDVSATSGPAPEAGRCNARFAGQTAVCWTTGCTYKNVATSACTGGANPGQMYTCAMPGASAAPPVPRPVEPAWKPVGLGDCPGRDVSGSAGPNPDPSKCTTAFAGQTAVCWTTGCTYKSVATAACTGGASPGQMYTCAAPGASTAPAAGLRNPPAASNWQAVGTGDCPGHDVGGTAGSTPDASKCDSGFAGQTAICWSNGCTYKNIAASACTGGSSPGQMYTCNPGSSASVAPPALPGRPKVVGKHYMMVNYTGETQHPHDFIIDWKGCKVAEAGADYQNGSEEITVQACKPGSRLVIRTEFKNSGYWAQYDWVLLDGGATLAGAYRDPAGCGPSAGKRAK
jgi:hypothetical protein